MLNRLIYNTRGRPVTRLAQTSGNDTAAENPDIAPGWNAVTIQDILKRTFMLTAAETKGFYPAEDCCQALQTEDAENAVPGLTDGIRNAVRNHRISPRLQQALYEEARLMATDIIEALTAGERNALLDLAGMKLEQTAPNTEQPPEAGSSSQNENGEQQP